MGHFGSLSQQPDFILTNIPCKMRCCFVHLTCATLLSQVPGQLHDPKEFVRVRLMDVAGSRDFPTFKRPHHAGRHSPCLHIGLTANHRDELLTPASENQSCLWSTFDSCSPPCELHPLSCIHHPMSLPSWDLPTSGTEVDAPHLLVGC